MIKIMHLNHNTVNTYIHLNLVFRVSRSTEYYNCFKALSKEPDPKLNIKGEWFTFFCYLEDCNSTRGLIADLEELQQGIKLKSMFDIERIVASLINFWH